MPKQTLLRPQSAGGNLVESTSEIKYADAGGGTTTFQLKIDSLSVQAQCQLFDATGEDDSFVTHKHTGRVSGQARIAGHIISGKLAGFNNLPDEEVLVHAVLGKYGTDDANYHRMRFKMAITSMSMQYSRQLTTIPIVIEGKITKSVSTKSIHESQGAISEQT